VKSFTKYLTELSNKTLKSYVKKADAERGTRRKPTKMYVDGFMAHKRGGDAAYLKTKFHKRSVGITRAKNTMYARTKQVPESVEQLSVPIPGALPYDKTRTPFKLRMGAKISSHMQEKHPRLASLGVKAYLRYHHGVGAGQRALAGMREDVDIDEAKGSAIRRAAASIRKRNAKGTQSCTEERQRDLQGPRESLP